MLFKQQFADAVNFVKPDLHAVITAASSLRHNTNFQKLLQIVLLVGNYLNASATTNTSYGFKLVFLTQLRNTKSADNKSTLLHYIAEVINERLVLFIPFLVTLTYFSTYPPIPSYPNHHPTRSGVQICLNYLWSCPAWPMRPKCRVATHVQTSLNSPKVSRTSKKRKRYSNPITPAFRIRSFRFSNF